MNAVVIFTEQVISTKIALCNFSKKKKAVIENDEIKHCGDRILFKEWLWQRHTIEL